MKNYIDSIYRLDSANTTNVQEGTIMVCKYYRRYKFYVVTKVTKKFVHFKKLGTNEEEIERSGCCTKYLLSPNFNEVSDKVIRRSEERYHQGKAYLKYVEDLDESHLKIYGGQPILYEDYPH